MKKEKLKRKVYYLLPSEIQKVNKNAKIRGITGSQFIRLLINK
jgi:hypothetical protein